MNEVKQLAVYGFQLSVNEGTGRRTGAFYTLLASFSERNGF